MSDSKMREEFEAWVLSHWPDQSLERFDPLHGVTEGEYREIAAQRCWQAWQYSRAAVVIELPENRSAGQAWDESSQRANYARVEGFNVALFEAKCRIEAAGLKVKQ